MFIDFKALKEAVSIEETVSRLGIKMAKSGQQLRGPCPACKSGGDRALVVTPAKGLFICFANNGEGGDQIALAAHIRGESVREAAEWLAGTVTSKPEPVTVTSNRKEHATEGFKPLDYLDPDHQAVDAVGFTEEVARAIGIGFAPKGILKGTVAIPLRLPDGTLVGYCGATELRLPKEFHLGNVVPFQKKSA